MNIYIFYSPEPQSLPNSDSIKTLETSDGGLGHIYVSLDSLQPNLNAVKAQLNPLDWREVCALYNFRPQEGGEFEIINFPYKLTGTHIPLLKCHLR